MADSAVLASNAVQPQKRVRRTPENLRDNSGYRENVLTTNNGGLEIQVGVAVVSDTIFNLGFNVCGTDATCP